MTVHLHSTDLQLYSGAQHIHVPHPDHIIRVESVQCNLDSSHELRAFSDHRNVVAVGSLKVIYMYTCISIIAVRYLPS